MAFGTTPWKALRYPRVSRKTASKERNKPIVESNKILGDLNRLIEELGGLLDDNCFLVDTMAFLTYKLHGRRPAPHSHNRHWNYNVGDGPSTHGEERHALILRIYDAELLRTSLLSMLDILATAYVERESPSLGRSVGTEVIPEYFYRLQTCRSKTRYDKEFGFRSSSQPLSPPEYNASELLQCSEMSCNVLEEHCHQEHKPSPLIAVSQSPARIIIISRKA
ncbi:hypothetical protein F4778DRAFT_98049 [Xylariomycetidae sp. FL2044]|nr:hypothetical protein F4778DRAFT_98049 [Xylariomycetidae sp. FL2044]